MVLIADRKISAGYDPTKKNEFFIHSNFLMQQF